MENVPLTTSYLVVCDDQHARQIPLSTRHDTVADAEAALLEAQKEYIDAYIIECRTRWARGKGGARS